MKYYRFKIVYLTLVALLCIGCVKKNDDSVTETTMSRDTVTEPTLEKNENDISNHEMLIDSDLLEDNEVTDSMTLVAEVDKSDDTAKIKDVIAAEEEGKLVSEEMETDSQDEKNNASLGETETLINTAPVVEETKTVTNGPNDLPEQDV